VGFLLRVLRARGPPDSGAKEGRREKPVNAGPRQAQHWRGFNMPDLVERHDLLAIWGVEIVVVVCDLLLRAMRNRFVHAAGLQARLCPGRQALSFMR
jgi:hypothetical protein